VAFDSRFELLSDRQVASAVNFHSGLGDWRRTAAGYQVLVLSPSSDVPLARLLRDRGIRMVAHGDDIVVLQRSSDR
jgi:hypothetical protein